MRRQRSPRPLIFAVEAGRRRRPPWRRWAFVVLAALLASGAAAVVATAGRDRAKPTTTTVARRTPPPRARQPKPAPRRTSAIDHVLAYTPFVARGTPRHRLIALTFDDGPSPYTSKIVDVLVRMHAPATFFIVGQQLTDFSSGLRDELRHGFEIGDHTENHAWLIRLGAGGQYTQIHTAAARLARAGAPFPRLFRPPYGAFDARTYAILRRLKMLMVLWSIDPGDWRRPGVRAIVQEVLSAARPGGIVELHDGGGDRSQTLAALPALIDGLRRRHYQLVTVAQLLAADPPPRHQPVPTLGAA